jgi:Ca2+-binding RTX toxin-like protein
MATFTAGTAGLNMTSAIGMLNAPTNVDQLMAASQTGEQQLWAVSGGYLFVDLALEYTADGASFAFNRISLLNTSDPNGGGTYKWNMTGSLLAGSVTFDFVTYDSITINIPGLITGTVTGLASGNLDDIDISGLTIASDASFANAFLQGNDTIVGNTKVDVLTGGAGHDTMTGGGAADDFVFAAKATNASSDTIKDFHRTQGDEIVLDNDFFNVGAPAGTIGGKFFAASNITATSLVAADDRLLYDKDSGHLYYDSNGGDGGGRVLLATLSGHPALAATDFLVVN